MKNITRKLTALHFIVPFFFFGLGSIFLLNPRNPVQNLDVSDYGLIILLLHQGQGVLFLGFALILFQIRRKSIELYFQLTSTFFVIILAILFMTCYYYYLLPSTQLIFMALINLACLCVLVYEKYNFKILVAKKNNKLPKGIEVIK